MFTCVCSILDVRKLSLLSLFQAASSPFVYPCLVMLKSRTESLPPILLSYFLTQQFYKVPDNAVSCSLSWFFKRRRWLSAMPWTPVFQGMAGHEFPAPWDKTVHLLLALQMLKWSHSLSITTEDLNRISRESFLVRQGKYWCVGWDIKQKG